MGLSSSQNQRFEMLFTQHSAPLYRYVQRRVNANDVEDLVAEVFTIALTKIDAIPQDLELAWLYRTAWNVISNHYRKTTPDLMENLPEESSGDEASMVIENMALQAAWSTLDSKDREILRLSAWEGLDGKELAATLNISYNAAATSLFRARTRLQEAFSAQAEKEGPVNTLIDKEGVES